MERGRFIVFEGIDGSGKSTAVAAVANELRQQGVEVWTTREETDTWRGAAVRRSIQERDEPLATTFLFLADRAAHVGDIEAHLAAGTHVLCDRFLHSTLAYQSVTLDQTMDNPRAWLTQLHEPFGLAPDHVVLFDIEPEMSIKRIGSRGAATNYEKADFLAKVRQAYLELVDGWTVLDASAPAEAVAEAALQAVLAALKST